MLSASAGAEMNARQEATMPSSFPTPIPSTSQAPATSTVSTSLAADPHLWAIIDPEVARENPVEDKHRRLARSHRSGPWDRELKPNAKDRDDLGVCGPIQYVHASPIDVLSDDFELRSKPAT